MKRIIIKISDGNGNEYSDDITEEMEEIFDGFTADKHFKGSFDHYTRPINSILTQKSLNKFKKNHLIYQWCENFLQNDNIPLWLQSTPEPIIELVNNH